jgi:hypothetical protein
MTWRYEGANASQVALSLVSVFSGYKFTQALSNVFVVGVGSVDEYVKLRDNLIDVADELEESGNIIEMIITPPISSGKYTGWLPESKWPDVNRVSEGVSSDV